MRIAAIGKACVTHLGSADVSHGAVTLGVNEYRTYLALGIILGVHNHRIALVLNDHATIPIRRQLEGVVCGSNGTCSLGVGLLLGGNGIVAALGRSRLERIGIGGAVGCILRGILVCLVDLLVRHLEGVDGSELKATSACSIDLGALLILRGKRDLYLRVRDVENGTVGSDGRSGHREHVVALTQIDTAAIGSGVLDLVDLLAFRVGALNVHRQARGPSRGIPAVPTHLDNNHVLRLGDSLVLFLLRLFGSHLLLVLIVDERPGTTANHGNRDNNARHDSGNLARVLLLGRIRTGTRLIGKGLGRNRAAALARSGSRLGHQCGFINRNRTRHAKVRRHDVERFMSSSRIGAVLLGICIGLLKGQGARLDFALCLRDV